MDFINWLIEKSKKIIIFCEINQISISIFFKKYVNPIEEGFPAKWFSEPILQGFRR